MKDYKTDKINNICLLGHGGSGKTSLAETLAFNAGLIDRLGKVVDGTTYSDYDPEETKRTISIGMSLAAIEHNNSKINVMDTPGYFDFVGEVMEAVKVSEAAVIVLSGKSGVAVGTEKTWAYAEENNISASFFISKLDEENADFDKTYKQIRDTFGSKCVAFQLPIFESGVLTGSVDVICKKAYKYSNGKPNEIEMPEDIKAKLGDIFEGIKEAVAETSEDLMEKYFSGEDFTDEELHNGIRAAITGRSIFPVFCGSAVQNVGTNVMMDIISGYFPTPAEANPVKGKNSKGEEVSIKISESGSLKAFVFKTIADPFVGRITFFKVISGMLKGDMAIYNANKDKSEKVAQVFSLVGKKQVAATKFSAGDIGAVAKLQFTQTGDTLCTENDVMLFDGIDFPEPMISMAIYPKSKGDEEKISTGLHKLQDEDQTFKTHINTETHQTIISGIGEQHLDIITSKLKAKYNVDVVLEAPIIAYRETLRKKVFAEGKHKKQSGGHGQYGHVKMEFEPGETEDLIFEEKVFGGSVPRQYYPAVEKGLRESILKGVLAGYPVVNLKATLLDGSYHDVDSSEMAFKLAAHIAFKTGMEAASPVLLEPIDYVEVFIPDEYMGDIIGDLNKRRGHILGMNPQDGGIQQVVAYVPQSEMVKYATDLRSMTQARGQYKMKFERYDEAPTLISKKVMDDAKRKKEEEN